MCMVENLNRSVSMHYCAFGCALLRNHATTPEMSGISCRN